MKALKEHRFEQNPKEAEFYSKFIKDYGDYNTMSQIVFGSNERGFLKMTSQKEKCK